MSGKSKGTNDGPCSIQSCGAHAKYRGWCEKHYSAWYRNGDPLKLTRKPKGSGTAAQHGYVVFGGEGGKKFYEHIQIAERALGRPLPAGVEVHHVDCNGLNNTPSNLVICPDAAYHRLLHKRQRALDACGHAEYSRCWICGKWDAPETLTIRNGRTEAFHAACHARYHAEGRARRSAARDKAALAV